MERSYTIRPAKPKVKATHKCPECRKTYKVEAKLKSHVEKEHYYCTYNPYPIYDYVLITYEMKIPILIAASQYLREILDGQDFPVLGGNQKRFLDRIIQDRILIGCDWDRAIGDFYCFMRMGTPYYDTNFCPSLIIDFLWHATIVKKPTQYGTEDPIFPSIPHCAKERTDEQDRLRYKYFCDVFRVKFSHDPYEGNISDNSTPASIEEMYQVVDQLKTLADQYTANIKARQEALMVENERLKAAELLRLEQVRAAERLKQARIKEAEGLLKQIRVEDLDHKNEANRHALGQALGVEITMAKYLRYKLISKNHPTLDHLTLSFMINNHSCRLCNPAVRELGTWSSNGKLLVKPVPKRQASWSSC